MEGRETDSLWDEGVRDTHGLLDVLPEPSSAWGLWILKPLTSLASYPVTDTETETEDGDHMEGGPRGCWPWPCFLA